MHTPGKREWAYTSPGVRIPLSPPVFSLWSLPDYQDKAGVTAEFQQADRAAAEQAGLISLAQLAEQLTVNSLVVGSGPIRGTTPRESSDPNPNNAAHSAAAANERRGRHFRALRE